MKLEKKHGEAVKGIIEFIYSFLIIFIVFKIGDEIEVGYLNTDVSMFEQEIESWQPYLTAIPIILTLIFFIVKNGFEFLKRKWWVFPIVVIYFLLLTPLITKKTLLAINKIDTSRTITRDVVKNKNSDFSVTKRYDSKIVNRIDLPFEMEIQKDKNQVVSYLGLLDIPVYYRWKE